MVHYKLTYFNSKGTAEQTRQLFVLAGVEFEDHRIPYGGDEWPKLKSQYPFGTLPVLEVDGKQLSQSTAIARYVARKFGFAGKDEWEQAQVDALADQYKDYQFEIRPYIYIYSWYGIQKGDTEKLKKSVFEPAIAKHYKIFSDVLKNSGSGFLVGDSVTFIDLCLADNLDFFNTCGLIKLDDYPEEFKMLDEIPNEILLKILKKTNTNTTQNCRFLTTRMTSLITKYELQKKELKLIWIRQNQDMTFEMRLGFSNTDVIIFEGLQLSEQIEYLEETLNNDKVRISSSYLSMWLSGITILEEFVVRIFQHDRMRRLVNLHCVFCAWDSCFSGFLVSSRLNRLVICVKRGGTAVNFPTEFFESVAQSLTYISEDITEFPHFTDDVIKKRRLTCKGTLCLRNCNTGLTPFCMEYYTQKVKNFKIQHLATSDWEKIQKAIETMPEKLFQEFRPRSYMLELLKSGFLRLDH